MFLEMILMFIGLFAFSFLGGYISRMAGGGGIDLPLGLDQWIYTIPMAAIGVLLTYETWLIQPEFLIYDSYLLTASVYGLSVLTFWFFSMLGKRMGHGQYMDLAHFLGRVSTPEKVEFIVKFFFGKDPSIDGKKKGNFWRDFFGLSLTGLAPVLPLVILLSVLGYFVPAILIAIGGLSKAIVYTIGWETNLHQGVDWLELHEETAVGEFYTGVFSYMTIFVSFMMIFS